MWNTLKWSLLGLVVAASISLAGVAGYAIHDNSDGSGSASSNSGEYAILNEIQDVLQEDFVLPDNVKPDVLQKGAIDGAISALNDSHTVYITPEAYQNGVDLISGTFDTLTSLAGAIKAVFKKSYRKRTQHRGETAESQDLRPPTPRRCTRVRPGSTPTACRPAVR